MDIFIYGESVHESTIIQTPGGSALNASLGFSLLGMNCFIHTTCGSDYNGELIKRTLDAHQVNTRYLRQSVNPANVFISKNGKALAAQVASEDEVAFQAENTQQDYCLIFATEMKESTLASLVKQPWKGLFIDLGPKYIHNSFPLEGCDCTIIGNQTEAENNPCDVIKLGKVGARWHDIHVPGNGHELPYTTGAGDLFDVVLIFGILSGKTSFESLKEAVTLSQKACTIPGSSSKIDVLREFKHFV